MKENMEKKHGKITQKNTTQRKGKKQKKSSSLNDVGHDGRTGHR